MTEPDDKEHPVSGPANLPVQEETTAAEDKSEFKVPDVTSEKSESITVSPLTNGNNNQHPPPPPLLNPLEPLPIVLYGVEGIDKLRRAIGKELVSENSNERCSNLPHLLSIVECILPSPVHPEDEAEKVLKNGGDSHETNPSPPAIRKEQDRSLRLQDNVIPAAVLKPFNYFNPTVGKTIRFIVDIVSRDGDAWAKVSARNPKSLALLAAGGGGYGQKSILDHAKDYIECAKQNPAFFKPPRITFIFTTGIGTSLAKELESLGIKVKGERIEDSELAGHPRIKPYQHLLYESDSNSEEEAVVTSEADGDADSLGSDGNTNPSRRRSSTAATLMTQFRNPSLEGIKHLNLDITALLAYVSNLTNGHINVHFKTAVLTQQLEAERRNPQKPILDSIFRGRELYCCLTAIKEFNSILATVGGELEKERAKDFLKRIKVVPDQMSERSKIDIVGNIKLRSLTIFGTGDSLKAVTVTANSGFVRSAKHQGVDFPVFLHESRALTEQKERYYL